MVKRIDDIPPDPIIGTVGKWWYAVILINKRPGYPTYIQDRHFNLTEIRNPDLIEWYEDYYDKKPMEADLEASKKKLLIEEPKSPYQNSWNYTLNLIWKKHT